MSADNWTVCPKCKAEEDIYVSGETTFREDYEFWGAEDGRVQWDYSGRCTVCDLRVSLKGSKPFWSPAVPAR